MTRRLCAMLVMLGFAWCSAGLVGCDTAAPGGGGGANDTGPVDDGDGDAGGGDGGTDDGNGGGTNDGGDGGAGAPGALFGQVSGVGGQPIAGVSVSLNNGRSASTDDNGFYSFSDLEPGSNIVATFRLDGFATTSKSFDVLDGSETTPGCVFMATAAEPVTFDAGTTGTQRSGDSAVTIEAGTLVDASGNPVNGDVELTATFIDPSTENISAFPGSFEMAQSTSGDMVQLESFGFTIYEVTQNGEPVNLADGSTATIEYVLPENTQGNFVAGDTIPLWEFDETTAMWMEAGTGEVREASDGSGRLAWFAEVPHFSAWNCDAPLEDKQCIEGRVTANGNPVSGAEVSAVGLTYNGTSVDRTSADGTFCVDVKRNSTVRIEVRLNGSAAPVFTVDVTVPNSPASCATGDCVTPPEVNDIDVTLDSCVHGVVTDETGAPVTGVTVHVTPGETVVTDTEGKYCAATVPDREVYVFAEGRPSVAVQTPPSGSCLPDPIDVCAEANLNLALPGDGDTVGTLMASKLTSYSDFGDSETFSLSGTFLTADFDDLSAFSLTNFDTVVETIDTCVVATTEFSVELSNDIEIGDFLNSGIGALDPGNPGTAGNGSATALLEKGDPNSVEPPAPYLAGIYSPNSEVDLIATGFDAGQTIDFGFPGGADIGAFDISVDVPANFNITSPNLGDSAYNLDLASSLNLTWDAGASSDAVTVYIVASAADSIPGGTGGTFEGTFVTISCEFPDNGSATVSQDALARIPSNVSSVTLSVSRVTKVSTDVPLLRTGGTGVVEASGAVGVSRSFFPGGDQTGDIPGDIPGDLPDDFPTDPCELIPCPDGTVCNPNTFMCDPV